MGSHLGLNLVNPVFGSDYLLYLKSLAPIALWPQNERSGTTINCLIDSSQDGTYTGATLGKAGGPHDDAVADYDGINDYGDVLTTPFAAAFDGAEWTILVWAKAGGASLWTSSLYNRVFEFVLNTTTDFVRLVHYGGTNNLTLEVRANNDNDYASAWASGGTLDWICFAMTRSESSDEEIVHVNGAHHDTVNTLAAWGAGDLTRAIIAAANTVPDHPWFGPIGPLAVWDTPLAESTLDQMYEGAFL